MKLTRRRFLGLGLGLVAANYPLFIERYLIVTNRYRISVPHLPEAFRGLRLVQLADLHYGSLVPLNVIRHVVRRANRLPRDVIVCTGDYVHERDGTAHIEQVWPVLAQLHAPSGVFSVLGNHDHWANTERSAYWLKRTRQDLRHKSVRLERNRQPLWLAGAGDFWEDHRPLDELLGQIPESDCRLVLAHNPDSADSDFTARVDLMLSGHTHGGQVSIPLLGPPVLPVRNRNYTSGLKQSKRGTNVFISRGIGWALLPVRFNCLPEIVLLELVPAQT